MNKVPRHPEQPIIIVDGIVRFKRNRIVDDLLDFARSHGFGMNEIAMKSYSQEDRNQFAQLIGYSVGGWSTLSYAMDVEKMCEIAEEVVKGTNK